MAEFHRLGQSIALVALAFVSCSQEATGPETGVQGTPPRAGQFGSLRDFVLFELPGPIRQRVLFVDRFEATRADWIDFAASPAGVRVQAGSAARFGDGALPVGHVSLRQARAFAAWRFARLPRLEEWQAAVRGDGRYYYPWGSKPDATRANTSELGLLEPTLVGTFESGRRATGQPYDLIGNVSEWTETVPVQWCLYEDRSIDSPSIEYVSALADARRMGALAVWQPVPGIMPAMAAVAARSDRVPREVAGGDFQLSMSGPGPSERMLGLPAAAGGPTERLFGGDRRLRTGLRLVTTPRELLLALLAAEVEPTPLDYEQLARFVRRKGHHRVLSRAWADLAPEALTGPLAPWLAERLDQ